MDKLGISAFEIIYWRPFRLPFMSALTLEQTGGRSEWLHERNVKWCELGPAQVHKEKVLVLPSVGGTAPSAAHHPHSPTHCKKQTMRNLWVSLWEIALGVTNDWHSKDITSVSNRPVEPGLGHCPLFTSVPITPPYSFGNGLFTCFSRREVLVKHLTLLPKKTRIRQVTLCSFLRSVFHCGRYRPLPNCTSSQRRDQKVKTDFYRRSTTPASNIVWDRGWWATFCKSALMYEV